MPLDMAAIGRIINETIVYPDSRMESVLGSPAAYSTICASRLGAKTGIITRIGTDFPKRLLRPFKEAKVDIAGITCAGDVSTTNELVYAKNGSKVIRYIKKSPEIVFDDIPQSYLDASLFYVCPMDFDVSLDTLEELRTLSGGLAVDLGGFGGAHSAPSPIPQMVRDFEGVKRLVGIFDIVKASDEDCRRLTGNGESNGYDLARCFLDWGAKISVITRGAKGVFIVSKDCEYNIPAFPGRPVEPTGAGDTYMAGFLVAYLRTNDLWKAGLFGAFTALSVIERKGGASANRMPTWNMVEKRLVKESGQSWYEKKANIGKIENHLEGNNT